MLTEISFKSNGHKQRFIETMRAIDKIYDNGKYDQEYSAAVYLLTADLSIWEKVFDYVSSHGILFTSMLKEVDFSGGHSIMVALAANLFNSSEYHCDVAELMRLDSSNFNIAMDAICLRRDSYQELTGHAGERLMKLPLQMQFGQDVENASETYDRKTRAIQEEQARWLSNQREGDEA